MDNVDFSQYKKTVYDTLSTGIVYGAYLVVYVASVYVFLRKSGRPLSRPRMIMFGITTFTFVLGTFGLVLLIVFQFQATLLDNEDYSTNSSLLISFQGTSTAWAAVTRLMYILSDLICTWRTVVLWDKDKRIIAILLLFILGATAGGVSDVYFTVAFLCTGQIKLSIEDPIEVGQRAIIVVGSTLATNLLSTGLIAWKAWKRRVTVRKHLCEGGTCMRGDRIFALLIESGFIYCCIWILYSIAAFGVIYDPGFTSMGLVSGLYSTLIIILVGLQISPVEYYSTHSTRMPLTREPALGQPGDSSMRQDVISIHRDYVPVFNPQIPSTARSTVFSIDEEKVLLP